MHSWKNAVIAILLLGVSYGVYEFITTPHDANIDDAHLVQPLIVDDGSAIDAGPGAVDPHIELPAPSLPEKSPSAASTQAFGSEPAKQQPQVEPIPSAGSTANRQAGLDPADAAATSNQWANAQSEPLAAVARDEQLIEALKEQLEERDPPAESSAEDFVPPTKMLANNDKANLDQPVNLANELPNRQADPVQKSSAQQELASPTASSSSLPELWPQVESLVQEGRFREALAKLTPFYRDPDLSGVQHQRLVGWLDALAGKVIYSAEHHFSEAAYQVGPNETIADLARRWNVTDRLLANINQSLMQNGLSEGAQLKQVVGPFHAEVNMSEQVITVFVDNLYAGRFSMQVAGGQLEEGQFRVARKADTARTSAGQSVRNLIELDNGVRLAEVADPSGNVIGLNAKDAADLFTILTDQSQVFITR